MQHVILDAESSTYRSPVGTAQTQLALLRVSYDFHITGNRLYAMLVTILKGLRERITKGSRRVRLRSAGDCAGLSSVPQKRAPRIQGHVQCL
ncbi:uncharacterized protein LOC124551143 isoform X2 [Schistocerca americana]|uniref:uncharacterized protein LOC124551143 isoform X2 n=1 Tax=Schistocerca americana TaxID=7009 RepID=UPI001F4F58ED|nr:uncharacterized protein LOC124551143 isoform X2 [Schistocerca americana]